MGKVYFVFGGWKLRRVVEPAIGAGINKHARFGVKGRQNGRRKV